MSTARIINRDICTKTEIAIRCPPMGDVIYFDNNATTRPLPEVADAMDRCVRDEYANPSSVHRFGQATRHRVESAREQVAGLIGASPREIVFTSSGTEAINLSIRQAGSVSRGAIGGRAGNRRFVTTTVEHSAGLRVAEQLEAEGYTVDYVGVDREGRLDLAEWGEKLTEDTALASLIHTNNETGVMLDVAGAVAIAAERGVPVHIDAVQAVGKLPVDVASLPVQFLSLSAHKFHGPKGAGALFVRRRTRLGSLIVGGAQERGLRAGTENVAGIVGMGVAAEAAVANMDEVAAQVGKNRDTLEQGILSSVPFARVHGGDAPRIHNTTNIGFKGLGAEAILILLSEAGICASSGSACSSGSLEPSHVLRAMGIEEEFAHGAIRFSLSRFNTPAEVAQVVAALPGLLAKLTKLNRR